MFLLVKLFAILKFVFFSIVYLLYNRDTEKRSIPDILEYRKNTTLNTKDLKRGTERINIKMT